jgi:hypothetical protein
MRGKPERGVKRFTSADYADWFSAVSQTAKAEGQRVDGCEFYLLEK